MLICELKVKDRSCVIPRNLASEVNGIGMLFRDRGVGFSKKFRSWKRTHCDFFWGYGQPALDFAGTMKAKGRYFILVPNSASNS